MAYIVSSLTSSQAPSGTSFTPELPAHQTDDLLLVCVTNDGGGTTLATASSGWAFIGTQAISGANRSAWCYKIAASSAEANPTITGANDDFAAVALVIRDADTTNPFGSLVDGTDYKRGDYTGTTTASSPAATTSNNENLLLYSWSSDGTVGLRVPMGDLSFVDYVAGLTAVCLVVGWVNQYTSGAVPSVTMTRTSSTNGGNSWVLAVKNKSGGGLRGECASIATTVRLYGTGFEAGTYTAPNNNPPNITTIDGLGVYTATDISDSAIYTAQISNAINTNAWVGGWDTFTAKDLSGALLSVRWAAPTTIALRVASKGFICVFADSSNNWKAFRLAQNKYNQMVGASTYVSHIDIDNGSVYASGGTLNTADIVRIGWLYERASGSTSAAAFAFQPVHQHGGMVFVGGNNDRPATASDIVFSSAQGPSLSSLAFNGIKDLCELQGSQQVVLPVSCQLGDGGTSPSYIQLTGASIETPLPYSQNYLWNVADNKINFVIYAGSSDTIDLSSAIIRANSPQNFTIHASSTTSNVYNFQGASIIGWNVTWKTGVTCTGVAFKECGEIDFKGASITGCTIFSTTSTNAAASWNANGATVATSTIDLTGTSAGYHISLGASVTAITLNGVTLSGTPGTDKIYSALASGTLTITTDGTGTALVAGDVTFVGGSTAVAVIAAPQVYQSVTISNATAGSRIQIYDTTSSTELYNGTPTFPYTWTDASPASADRAIRLRVAYVSGTSAKQFIEASIGTCGQTSGTAAVSYLVNQVNDTTYNSNGLNGPTIYATSGITFVDSGSNDRVDCNIGGGSVTYPTIYACFVYWNFTATGIANDFTYVDAPDTANYLFSGMKIRNTSATDLTVTGGYGRDATSGLSKDIVDTAGSTGNIFLAPDHVVAYQTTGTYAITGDISTVLTAVSNVPADVWTESTRTLTTTIPTAAQISTQVLTDAQSTPIHSDLRKVANATVTGSGTANDPWGPA